MVAVITGGSRGIGRATAVALAEEGFAVALLARSLAGLDETRELVVERGGKAIAAVADVTDPQAVRDASVAVAEQLGERVALLVNNAGSLRAIGPVWEVNPDDWWTDVRTSLGGAFVCCREFVPGMIERGEGRIVNLTSYVAIRPTPYQTGYAAGKAALASLTEALAASLEGTGVKAFSVAPGFTETEMTRNLVESEAGQRWVPEAGKGRIVDVERSARLIAFLASGGGDVLNGRFIHALDDVDELLMRIDEIRRDDLYAPRLRRLRSEPTERQEPGGLQDSSSP
jgi:NAD(P)-dependent dehydrogenase (short-subunit alcohol dehydrogenase family)